MNDEQKEAIEPEKGTKKKKKREVGRRNETL